jgi:hypothetical protein
VVVPVVTSCNLSLFPAEVVVVMVVTMAAKSTVNGLISLELKGTLRFDDQTRRKTETTPHSFSFCRERTFGVCSIKNKYPIS